MKHTFDKPQLFELIGLGMKEKGLLGPGMNRITIIILSSKELGGNTSIKAIVDVEPETKDSSCLPGSFRSDNDLIQYFLEHMTPCWQLFRPLDRGYAESVLSLIRPAHNERFCVDGPACNTCGEFTFTSSCVVGRRGTCNHKLDFATADIYNPNVCTP
jgi:hypothetical protein